MKSPGAVLGLGVGGGARYEPVCDSTMTRTAASLLGSPAPAVIDWRRVRNQLRRVITLIIAGFGVLLLVREGRTFGRAVASVAHANPLGLLVAALLGATTYLGAAVAITAASGRSLSIRRTTAVQLAAACTNRISPAGLGAMATNLRYLERDGATRPQAVTAIGVTSGASFVVHAIATVAVLALIHRPFGAAAPAIPNGIPWRPALLLALLAVALGVLVAPRLARRLSVSVRHGWTEVRLMCADPGRIGRLLVGTIGVTFGHGLAFVAAVTACGVHLPVIGALAVFLAGSAVGSAAPTPGGLGALEAALVAGLTAAGAAVAPAVAGVLAYRLVTYWLPVIPGAVALKILRPTLWPAEVRDDRALRGADTVQ